MIQKNPPLSCYKLSTRKEGIPLNGINFSTTEFLCSTIRIEASHSRCLFYVYQRGQMMKTRKDDNMLKIPIIEIILSMISAWWAMVLFNSPTMFSKLPKTYEFFSAFADEYQWAILFSTGAIVKILGIILQIKWLRKIGLLLSAFIYAMIAAGYYLGTGWFNIGFGTFAAISIMALWGMREVHMRNG